MNQNFCHLNKWQYGVINTIKIRWLIYLKSKNSKNSVVFQGLYLVTRRGCQNDRLSRCKHALNFFILKLILISILKTPKPGEFPSYYHVVHNDNQNFK